MIPNPLTDGRLLIALDDFINPKTGRKIFGCAHFFDHAAKANQSKYPWAQNVVLVGLLKRIKGRWACLPLAHRFYLPKKAIASKSDNMAVPGEATLFQTKLEQATEMLVQLADHFAGMPITVVCDSWFGNNGLQYCALRYGAKAYIGTARQTTQVWEPTGDAYRNGSKAQNKGIKSSRISLWAFPRGAGYYKCGHAQDAQMPCQGSPGLS